jgi:hypothetical protein
VFTILLRGKRNEVSKNLELSLFSSRSNGRELNGRSPAGYGPPTATFPRAREPGRSICRLGSVGSRRVILGFAATLGEWERLLGAAPRRGWRDGPALVSWILRALRAPRVQALCSKSKLAEGTENRVCTGRLKRVLLPGQDSVAGITPGVIFNSFMSVIVDIAFRLYSRPAVLRAVTGIESETNKTSGPIIGLKIAI